MTTVTRPTSASIAPPMRSDRTWIMGDAPAFFADEVQFWLDAGKIAPVVKMRFAHLNKIYTVTDADYVKQILQTNNHNYIKEPRMVRILTEGGDTSLFTTDGDDWLWRRRLMQPAFHRKQISKFGTAIVDETEKMIAKWVTGENITVDEAMRTLTMHVIGRTMLSVDMGADSAESQKSTELHHAYLAFGELYGKRLTNAFRIPLQIPTPTNKRIAETNTTIITYLEKILDERRDATEPKHDLLDMLLSARLEEDDQSFTKDQLIMEMSGIVFAGHETTANTLTWLFYLLSQYPDIEAKVYAEIEQVVGDRTPDIGDVQNLTYLRMVIDETMRLYPSAPVTSRYSVETDQFGSYQIDPGAMIFINIIGLHYDERYWDEPWQFDPERFSAENKKSRHRFAHIPFLKGPRQCIGEQLALTEMVLILATLLQKYRLTLPPNTPVEPEIQFTLQMKGHLNMRFEKRDS